MNLSDLAGHICEQCGMNDTDDVSAAKRFLQRRLEMIWNAQLWRASLIEATLTLAPDGTCTLANTVWIPSRSTLLLPPEFDSVLAVRADNHAMNVASLESYYRTDTDWLNMRGDPTEFQVLRPVVWENETPATITLIGAGAIDLSGSADGVAMAKETVASAAAGSPTANQYRVLYQACRVAGQSNPAAITFANVSGQTNMVPAGSVLDGDGNFYIQGFTVGGVYSAALFDADTLQDTNPALPGGFNVQISTSGIFFAQVANYWLAGSQPPGFPVQTQVVSYPPVATLAAADTFLAARQRVRLTTRPQLSANLRVLGKTACPLLGDYDEAPINKVEPCLMAFARGDMLLRQRQNGKAQLAAQEGAALLAQLARSEAFQTASSFRIVPDNGFGGDNFIAQPNSLHPL